VQIIINIDKDDELEKLLQMFSKLNINSIQINKNRLQEIDFSKNRIKSFKNIDGVDYQKRLR